MHFAKKHNKKSLIENISLLVCVGLTTLLCLMQRHKVSQHLFLHSALSLVVVLIKTNAEHLLGPDPINPDPDPEPPRRLCSVWRLLLLPVCVYSMC